MDPTQQAALQNALMLQAIKSGGQMQQQPPTDTGQAMGANPMQMAGAAVPPQPQPMPTPQQMSPVDPASMTGGLAGGQPNQQQMAASNPVVSALMSQIPGGGQ